MNFMQISRRISSNVLTRARDLIMSGCITEEEADTLSLLIYEYAQSLKLYKFYEGKNVIIPSERHLREEIRQFCDEIEETQKSHNYVKTMNKTTRVK